MEIKVNNLKFVDKLNKQNENSERSVGMDTPVAYPGILFRGRGFNKFS